jgi:hypothetical protein
VAVVLVGAIVAPLLEESAFRLPLTRFNPALVLVGRVMMFFWTLSADDPLSSQ